MKKMKTIKANEISFVVQGIAKHSYMKKALTSIRKYYPGAEIILSTWEGCDTQKLDYDIVIKSKDPGMQYLDEDNKIPYNINRMLLSTQVGIQRATRKYVMKLRCDMWIRGNEFLSYYDAFPKRDSQYVVSKNKIIVGSIFSLKYEQGETEKLYTPFHISDFYAFGLKEDIELLYQVPLVDLDTFARYFKTHEKPREYPVKAYEKRLWKFPPEQYIVLEFAKRVLPDLQFEHCLDYESVPTEVNERFIINNFIIIDYQQSKIISQKMLFRLWSNLLFCPERLWKGIYRNYVYLQDYKKYLDQDYELPQDKIAKRRKRYAWCRTMKDRIKPLAKWIMRLN